MIARRPSARRATERYARTFSATARGGLRGAQSNRELAAVGESRSRVLGQGTIKKLIHRARKPFGTFRDRDRILVHDGVGQSGQLVARERTLTT